MEGAYKYGRVSVPLWITTTRYNGHKAASGGSLENYMQRQIAIGFSSRTSFDGLYNDGNLTGRSWQTRKFEESTFSISGFDWVLPEWICIARDIVLNLVVRRVGEGQMQISVLTIARVDRLRVNFYFFFLSFFSLFNSMEIYARNTQRHCREDRKYLIH